MPYYMRRNHANRTPRHHVFVDTETVPEPLAGRVGWDAHQLLCGVAYRREYRDGKATRGKEIRFTSRAEFWDWLTSGTARGTQVWVWAHNAAFDFTTLGLWGQLDSDDLQLKGGKGQVSEVGQDGKRGGSQGPSLVTAGPPFLADCHDGAGKSFRFVDSLNWAFLSLKKIGPMLGLPKLDMPGELGTLDDLLAYCERDVEILEALVVKILALVRDYDLGNMQWTLSAQAMSHYRHRHLDWDILTGPDEQIRPLERRAYYGARQEVYKRGNAQQGGRTSEHHDSDGRAGSAPTLFATVHRIDCNACYPFVMSVHDYPTRPFRYHRGIEPRKLLRLLDSFIAVAVVRIYSQNEPYPQKRKWKTSWRVGRVDTVLCGEELRRALEMGHVIDVVEARTYVRAPIFATWFQETQRWREESAARGDRLEQLLLKRMRNSLHGKFGQSARNWTTVPGKVSMERWGEYPIHNGDGKPMTRARGVAGMLQIMGTEPTARGAAPIIAACVNAAAREHMRVARLLCSARNVYYEDADSLHVSQAGLDALEAAGWIHPTQPGKFKIEESAPSAEYWGVKNYRLGDNRVVAGRSAKGEVDAKGVWHQTEWVSLDGLLSSGRPDAPITYDRAVGDPESFPSCGYDEEGWIVYRPGE